MTDMKTILVVDDDRDLRVGLQAVLQERGYRALVADDGQVAQEMIVGQRPDLVILDLMMPRWGGLQVLNHFSGKTDAPPFIMITASEGESVKADAEQGGVVDYIRKPFTMDRLLEGVTKAFQKVASEGEASESAVEKAVAPLPIRCRCSNCGARVKASLRLFLQTRPCPGCKQPMVVRPETPADEGPMLVLDDRMPGSPRRRPL